MNGVRRPQRRCTISAWLEGEVFEGLCSNTFHETIEAEPGTKKQANLSQTVRPSADGNVVVSCLPDQCIRYQSASLQDVLVEGVCTLELSQKFTLLPQQCNGGWVPQCRCRMPSIPWLGKNANRGDFTDFTCLNMPRRCCIEEVSSAPRTRHATLCNTIMSEG